MSIQTDALVQELKARVTDLERKVMWLQQELDRATAALRTPVEAPPRRKAYNGDVR